MNERENQRKELWERYLAVCNGDKKFAQETMWVVTGKTRFENCSGEDIKNLYDDIQSREKELLNEGRDEDAVIKRAS